MCLGYVEAAERLGYFLTSMPLLNTERTILTPAIVEKFLMFTATTNCGITLVILRLNPLLAPGYFGPRSKAPQLQRSVARQRINNRLPQGKRLRDWNQFELCFSQLTESGGSGLIPHSYYPESTYSCPSPITSHEELSDYQKTERADQYHGADSVNLRRDAAADGRKNIDR